MPRAAFFAAFCAIFTESGYAASVRRHFLQFSLPRQPTRTKHCKSTGNEHMSCALYQSVLPYSIHGSDFNFPDALPFVFVFNTGYQCSSKEDCSDTGPTRSQRYSFRAEVHRSGELMLFFVPGWGGVGGWGRGVLLATGREKTETNIRNALHRGCIFLRRTYWSREGCHTRTCNAIGVGFNFLLLSNSKGKYNMCATFMVCFVNS